MIYYIPGCISYGSENFGLESLHVDSVGLPGATPQFYSVAPYRFDYSFVDGSRWVPKSLYVWQIYLPCSVLSGIFAIIGNQLL